MSPPREDGQWVCCRTIQFRAKMPLQLQHFEDTCCFAGILRLCRSWAGPCGGWGQRELARLGIVWISSVSQAQRNHGQSTIYRRCAVALVLVVMLTVLIFLSCACVPCCCPPHFRALNCVEGEQQSVRPRQLPAMPGQVPFCPSFGHSLRRRKGPASGSPHGASEWRLLYPLWRESGKATQDPTACTPKAHDMRAGRTTHPRQDPAACPPPTRTLGPLTSGDALPCFSRLFWEQESFRLRPLGRPLGVPKPID